MGPVHGSAESFELVQGALRELRSPAATLDEASDQLPRGAYTTFRTYQNVRVVRLSEHVARLSESVAIQGHPQGIDEGALRAALGALLRARDGESRIRLTFSPPRLFVTIEPFQPLPPDLYASGVRCVTVPLQREDPKAKDTRFLATAQTVRESFPPGIHEGLMLDHDDRILEGLSSNFFAVLGGVLRTEGERVLRGVTRTLILELATGVVPVDERPIALSALPQATEAFITSVSREILPVVEIDGAAIGNRRPGPITKRLREALGDLISRESEALA